MLATSTTEYWHSSHLFSSFRTFTFFLRCWLFTLIDIIVTTWNSRSLTITQPWEFVWTVATSLHITCISYIARFKCQSTFVAIITWSLCLRWLLTTIPSIKGVEFFITLWICDPLKSLCCCNKPDIGSRKIDKFVRLGKLNCLFHTNNDVAQLRNLCNPCSSSLIWNLWQ